MFCFVFLILHLLLTVTHTTNTRCGECQYLYTRNIYPQTIMQIQPLNRVLTIAGEFKKQCNAATDNSWITDKSYLLLKNGHMSLLYLRYYSDWLLQFYSSVSTKLEYKFIWYIRLKQKNYFKIQIHVSNTDATDTKVYINQQQIKYQNTLFTKITEEFQNIRQIELYHNDCVSYHYISICPPTTDKKFCDSGPSTLTAKLGSSKTLSCSTRTIITGPLEQTIKWSFVDSDGTAAYETILYTKNLISTAARENMITSTLNLANFTVRDIGRYMCALIDNQRTVQDTKMFQVTDEPEISSMVITANHSTEHRSHDLSQPITSDTTLSWNVTRWSDIENVTLDLQLNLTKTIQQPTAQNTSRMTSLYQSKHWKYYTFIINRSVDIDSITAVFKVDDQIFKKLTYIPIQTMKPIIKPAGNTNTRIFIICIVCCIVGCIGVIILNNIFWWKKSRQIKRNEIMAENTRQDEEDKRLNDTGQGEQDNYEVPDELRLPYTATHEAIAEQELYSTIEDDDHYATLSDIMAQQKDGGGSSNDRCSSPKDDHGGEKTDYTETHEAIAEQEVYSTTEDADYYATLSDSMAQQKDGGRSSNDRCGSPNYGHGGDKTDLNPKEQSSCVQDDKTYPIYAKVQKNSQNSSVNDERDHNRGVVPTAYCNIASTEEVVSTTAKDDTYDTIQDDSYASF